MIDIAKEEIVTLAQATKYVPSRRKGKKTHCATLNRWAKVGLRGVRLETIRIGGSLCTSLEKLQSFFNRLSELDGGNRDGAEPPASGQEHVERQLDQARIGRRQP